MYNYNFFNFKRLSDKILLTNDSGKFIFLSYQDFNLFVSSPHKLDANILSELTEKHFIVPSELHELNDDLIESVQRSKAHLFHPTSLFIIVINENCNSNCVYCQASSNTSVIRTKNIMQEETMFAVLDFILESNIQNLSIEFQGGEPLLSYPLIKSAILYMTEKAGTRTISFSVVTNLSLLTDDMAEFFKENDVIISFSLDGDEAVHNHNRSLSEPNKSFKLTEQGINILKKYEIEYGAIQTTTRYSLNYPKEIIDSYIAHGLSDIFVRPLTRLGTADAKWEEIGYSAEEFISFYERILNYMIELNKNDISMREATAVIFLSKIFGTEAIDYMDLRSPCGACIGQLAFSPEGDIFSCDEGRMLSYQGDFEFKIGNVKEDTYKKVISSLKCYRISKSSVIENNPMCAMCVYLPYCGICPVLNYHQTGSMDTVPKDDFRCKIYKGILDCIFSFLAKEETREVLDKWVKNQ